MSCRTCHNGIHSAHAQSWVKLPSTMEYRICGSENSLRSKFQRKLCVPLRCSWMALLEYAGLSRGWIHFQSFVSNQRQMNAYNASHSAGVCLFSKKKQFEF